MPLIVSKYAGTCTACRAPHAVGDKVEWHKTRRGVRCQECAAAGKQTLASVKEKPLRDNESDPIDIKVRRLPDKAALAVVLLDKGASAESMAGDLERVVRDLNEVLASSQYELRFPTRAEDDQ